MNTELHTRGHKNAPSCMALSLSVGENSSGQLSSTVVVQIRCKCCLLHEPSNEGIRVNHGHYSSESIIASRHIAMDTRVKHPPGRAPPHTFRASYSKGPNTPNEHKSMHSVESL